MNIKHLQYMIEIERVGSISQASKNLYVGQPNLSRILKEVEETVGFTIFDRTHQGIRPTERGMSFLQHAHNILREMDAIEAMGSGDLEGTRLRICIPHSAASFQMVCRFITGVMKRQTVNGVIRETHPKKALELLAGGQAELGVIRFREEYTQYFSELAATANLKFHVLVNYEDVILLHKDHPLAQKAVLTHEDLLHLPQITHSDRYFLPNQKQGDERSRIYTVDRLGQLTLLQSLPDCYMWSAPVPADQLEHWGIVQRKCERNTNRYSEAVVYSTNYIMSAAEKYLLDCLIKEYPKYIADGQ